MLSFNAITIMNACRCKCVRHDCWLGANAKYMADGRVQM